MFLCNVSVFGTMSSFCAQILTKILAASWILIDIVGAIHVHNFQPGVFT